MLVDGLLYLFRLLHTSRLYLGFLITGASMLFTETT